MDYDGNLTDAVFLAVITVLMAYRRPDATYNAANGKVTKWSLDEREGIPLSLHHTPLAITFGLFAVSAFSGIHTV